MTDIVGWHAHIYFTTPQTREAALKLHEQIATGFPSAILGRVHDRPVGPHPIPMYQVAFAPDLFPTLVPFIALHREGLTVLVHPDTLRPLADHTRHPMWMGAVLPLDTSVLPEVSERIGA
jgi:aromatic ring-cleaving dioxygenase